MRWKFPSVHYHQHSGAVGVTMKVGAAPCTVVPVGTWGWSWTLDDESHSGEGLEVSVDSVHPGKPGTRSEASPLRSRSLKGGKMKREKEAYSSCGTRLTTVCGTGTERVSRQTKCLNVTLTRYLKGILLPGIVQSPLTSARCTEYNTQLLSAMRKQERCFIPRTLARYHT